MLRLGLYTGASRTAMARASLILDFIMPTLDKRIDFTRTTAGTYVDSDGYIKSTPASKNLLTYTQEFDVSTWSKSATVAYPFEPALATYGPELVTNGDFSSTASWALVSTAPATASISGGKLTLVSPAGEATYARQAILTVGKWYRVTGNVTVRSGGVKIICGGPLEFTFSTTQSFVFYAYAGNQTFFDLSSGNLGTCDADFDNISVREVTSLGLLAPDGTLTADAVLPTATTAAHNVQQSGGGSGTPLTLSVYAKAGSHAFMQLSHGSNSKIYANFNLMTGTVGTVGASATATITPAGDGWYRCAMTFTPGAAASNHINPITSATAGYRESWAATGTESIYLWGAQLEAVPDANLVLGLERVSSPTITAINANGTVSVVGDTITCTCTTAGIFGFTIAALNAVVGQSYRLSVNLLTNSASRLMFADIGGFTIGCGTATGVIVRASANATSAGSYGLYATSGQIGDTFSVSLSSLSVRQITGTTGMPSTYTRNVGGLYPPRFDYDPVTKVPRGLLVEEQRTNLLLRSEEFENAAWIKNNASVTPAAAISPDGTMDASKLVEAATTTNHRFYQTATKAASTITRTFSVYLKAGERTRVAVRLVNQNESARAGIYFDLVAGTMGAPIVDNPLITNVSGGITPVGNGWFRCHITGTYDATFTGTAAMVSLLNGVNITYLGDGTSGAYVWGAQLEDGAFPTSYIPTAASQVTRTQDIATITGANFSNWYNQTEGTFVVEADTIVPSATTVYCTFSVNDGTGTNLMRNFVYAGKWGVSGNVGSSQFDLLQSGSYTQNVARKNALGYKVNDIAFSSGGVPPLTDSVAAIPTVSQLSLGFSSGASQLNGHIRSIRYYPTRLSNAQLQALTAP